MVESRGRKVSQIEEKRGAELDGEIDRDRY